MRDIAFFDYPKCYKDQKDKILSIFDEVASRGAFIMQQDLRDFEMSLANYLQSQHVVGVANATDGLEICCLSMKLKPGDEIICSAHTMLATAASIKLSGGVPVPVDIGADNLIDPDAIEAAITPNTVGIMPTQLNGRTCNMDRIMAVADKYGLFVIEDSAQALGSKFKGRSAGTFGKAGVFSFFPAKLLGCLGDGGAITTNDSEIYTRVYQLHDHGRNPAGEVCAWGRNSRLDNIQAAFLKAQLTSYDEKTIARRRKIAAIYHERLHALEQLQLPPAPDSDANHFDVYQNYELQADRRDQLKSFLSNAGVGTLIQWGGKALHQWECLDMTEHSLPRVENFFERCLMLPMNIFISDEDVHYICDQVYHFYRK